MGNASTGASEPTARTRALARLIGPYLAIVPSIIAARASEMGALASAFFQNAALVWITGALLVLAGIAILTFHRSWRGAAAIAISLLGWALGLRGLWLLLAPQSYAAATAGAAQAVPLVRAGFALLAVVGVWLTWVGWRPEKARP